MADATVQVEIEERSGGRVARVTIDNQRRLNCLSTPLILELSGGLFEARQTIRRCGRWCSPGPASALSSAART